MRHTPKTQRCVVIRDRLGVVLSVKGNLFLFVRLLLRLPFGTEPALPRACHLLSNSRAFSAKIKKANPNPLDNIK